MRIAIIGGTFDPIHDGHVAMARYVLKHHYVDEVWFMVAKDTPLKNHPITAFEHRANMVALAINGHRKMQVCTLENERDHTSYTIDTVDILTARYPKHTFVWLIGNDQATQLSAWKDIDQLIQKIAFYVFPRKDESITCAYPYTRMNMELIDVSSSEIRIGKKRHYLHKKVGNYINEQGLYMHEFVQSILSAKRFSHSERVANECVKLAKAHHVDVQKAYIAGILHDVCKEWPKYDLKRWIDLLEPMHSKEAAPIWHGYVATRWLRHQLGYRDAEVLDAIYHHVLGDGTSLLAKILYISDKIEPGRGYDASEQLELAMQDLDAGITRIKADQKIYLSKENVVNEG